MSDSLALALSLDARRQSTRGGGWRAVARQKEGNMLRIYHVVLEVLKQLQPALRRIELRDRDLARQLGQWRPGMRHHQVAL